MTEIPTTRTFAEAMLHPEPLTAEQLTEIRDWFERHRTDQCSRINCLGPPDAWAEYFAWLLEHAEAQKVRGPHP